MGDDDTGTTKASQPPRANPRDGKIDFTPYSIEQLRELQDSIDREAYPENFKNLLAALNLKEDPIVQPLPRSEVIAGRFTSRNGLPGWIQAKLSRSPVYGSGSLEVGPTEAVFSGWQRTWLGVPIEAQISRETANIQNVVQEGPILRFEIKRKYLPARRIRFQPESADNSQALLEQLPRIQSAGFLQRWSAIRDFNQRLRAVGGTPWVTPVIVALNVVVFTAMAIATRKTGLFTPQEFWAWGANFGPLTVNGQWWRLFTALFVHLSLLHLLLNMWALWNIGRLSERLYGRGTLLVLYVGAGVLASLSSVAWDPSLSSVGASGAIFGLFGAFLAFLGRQRHQIPASIVRKHWISTAAFVLFNLISGATHQGIDNAAHVGGLLSGFVLGLLLARPLDPEVRMRVPLHQSIAAATFIAIIIISAVLQVKGIGSGLTIPEQYVRTHGAYVSGEAKNLQLWNELAQRAAAGSISDADLGQRFEQDILPFWQAQKDQLPKEDENLKGPSRDYAVLVAEFATSRYEWASALIDATKNRDSSRAAEALKRMAETTAVNARLDRIWLRARMDHRPRALAAAPLVMKIRRFLSGYRWTCVNAPPLFGPLVADSDNKSDGPAMRHALGCLAQQLFMAGDYESLDSLMNQYLGSPEDLPDGSSRYEGLVRGLDDLFQHGKLSAEDAFAHTADWRRGVKGSAMADLIEAMIFSDWAWSARGTGYANSISSQNSAIYSYRTEMAAAALDEVADRASSNPLWYTISLEVGRDQSKDPEKLRAIFAQGIAKAPKYRSLYHGMLRILMPRWGGTYEDVDKFIIQTQKRTADGRGFERYAQLYSAYARLEGDELYLFVDTPAVWSDMKLGYQSLVRRYPTSDAVLNDFANFSCRAGDWDIYKQMRDAVGKRLSSTSWSDKYSVEYCDKNLPAADSAPGAQQPQPQSGKRIESLGGVHLGMTRTQLSAVKGNPIHIETTYWVYNSIDARHDGVITAVFSSADQGSPGVVVSIEYTGNAESAPGELPYLNDWTIEKMNEKFGAQMGQAPSGLRNVIIRFPNGVYVNSSDGKVSRYGISRQP